MAAQKKKRNFLKRITELFTFIAIFVGIIKVVDELSINHPQKQSSIKISVIGQNKNRAPLQGAEISAPDLNISTVSGNNGKVKLPLKNLQSDSVRVKVVKSGYMTVDGMYAVNKSLLIIQMRRLSFRLMIENTTYIDSVLANLISGRCAYIYDPSSEATHVVKFVCSESVTRLPNSRCIFDGGQVSVMFDGSLCMGSIGGTLNSYADKPGNPCDELTREIKYQIKKLIINHRANIASRVAECMHER